MTSINIRFTEPHERHMFAYSHSIVEAILTCPVWGLVRYVHQKYYPTNRMLALEAGGAMHDVFATVRLFQLGHPTLQDLYQHMLFHGDRIFGAERFDKIKINWHKITNPRDLVLDMAYKALNTADYFDDPDDRIRTLANMEETIIRYVDEMLGRRMDENRIWVADVNDPQRPVGIEHTFDVIITVDGKAIRYIGTIDGIVEQIKYPGTAMIDENKTASRLDEAWRESYEIKSQPTGYIAVARLITGLTITKCRMIGVKIKQTRSHEDFLSFITEREDYQLVSWVRSLQFADQIVAQYKDNPTDAPQFTHSCNRYFRACSFVQLCAADPETREDIFHNSMIEAPLSPSQQVVANASE